MSRATLDQFLYPAGGAAPLLPAHREHSGQRPNIQLERTVVIQQFKGTGELFDRERLWKDSIVAKLLPWYPRPVPSWENFLRCGEDTIYRTCRGCGSTKPLPYNCSLKWCPLCSTWLAYLRRRRIEAWSKGIQQPKHVVLTMRNTSAFTGKMLRRFQRALVSLRRSVFMRHVRGGCCSLEVTNESRGWHLHAHLLLDVDWLDAAELARTWAKRIQQDFAIVKVRDARNTDYLKEVSKYVVKGSELAGWQPEEIRQFVWTMRGRRTFFTFGTLRKFKPHEPTKPEPKRCECGCAEFIFETEIQSIIRETARLSK